MELRDGIMIVGLGLNLGAILLACGAGLQMFRDMRARYERIEERLPIIQELQFMVRTTNETVSGLQATLRNGITAQVVALATQFEGMRARCEERHGHGHGNQKENTPG